MQCYLSVSQFIDWQEPDVFAKAKQLSSGLQNRRDVAEACYLFVRDKIKHSWRYKLNPVTCKASDVSRYSTGYCYAKSHLLAALLRANDIPAGLCYQRVTIDDNRPPYSLHGLNAIYLEPYGWFRVDASGNQAADFCPPEERLAFVTDHIGEADFPEIWPEPLAVVVDSLAQNDTYLDVAENLPDIEIIKSPTDMQTRQAS